MGSGRVGTPAGLDGDCGDVPVVRSGRRQLSPSSSTATLYSVDGFGATLEQEQINASVRRIKLSSAALTTLESQATLDLVRSRRWQHCFFPMHASAYSAPLRWACVMGVPASLILLWRRYDSKAFCIIFSQLRNHLERRKGSYIY